MSVLPLSYHEFILISIPVVSSIRLTKVPSNNVERVWLLFDNVGHPPIGAHSSWLEKCRLCHAQENRNNNRLAASSKLQKEPQNTPFSSSPKLCVFRGERELTRIENVL